MTRARRAHGWLALLAVLAVAALFRVWLIAADGVSFDSDEAVVGLMARHIDQGHAIPIFFYGQHYMGSLDAILVAGGFQVWGESVHGIRWMQLILYLLSLATAYALAYEITRSRRVAGMTALLLAIPTSLGALYTTLTLGGYNEIVLLGNLVLLLSWQVTAGGRVRDRWRWAALGLAAGLGWWTNGAIVTACAVAGWLVLRHILRRDWRQRWRRNFWRGCTLAAVFFVIGSGPWWLDNLRHDWAALDFLTGGFGDESEGEPGLEPLPPGEAAAGLMILGLPALLGLRHPWAAGFDLTPGLVAAALVYLLLFSDGLAAGYARLRARDRPPLLDPQRAARRWVWLVGGIFGAIFVFSLFSDATGRYLMPVWVPVALGVALALDRLRRAGWALAAAGLGVLLAFQAGSVIVAARGEMGLQPQLVERLQTARQDDQAVLDFLAGQGITRGYAGYWTSYRLVFRSGEELILDTRLPHDAEKGFNRFDSRYPPYAEAVAAADEVAWITQNLPALDAAIAERLDAAGVTVRTRDFGRYRVYYDFSARVSPGDLGLDRDEPLSPSTE